MQGEAVVVDLGQRGILFALISFDSDMEFYNAFPVSGPSTPAGIKHYASLPVGTKGVLNPERFPGYMKLVTFTDMNDPKSVTLAQVWQRNDKGIYDLKENRMEELFGKGVKLKDIRFEITDEPVTIGSATITTESDIDPGTDGVNVGFYALAYDYNGETIITFRGTDYPYTNSKTVSVAGQDIPIDIYHGWSLGGGFTASEQGQMAVD